ncbi:hypothetical protein FA95DRAFT_1122722 [Auriscalpium vulgare]|uniref:Uncharacterized protein n=1 Tax=Auriscalpium vulgare TaxID=40419 RepID=A0ACB8R4X1_9AGAM|nr:hypothetical protein FA95DRAFT_1122722 [Auriscalpium vulgare]
MSAVVNGVPASVLIDNTAPSSLLSLSFVLASPSLCDNSRPSGALRVGDVFRATVTISTPDSAATSVLDCTLHSNAPCDIVLGRDWILSAGISGLPQATPVHRPTSTPRSPRPPSSPSLPSHAGNSSAPVASCSSPLDYSLESILVPSGDACRRTFLFSDDSTALRQHLHDHGISNVADCIPTMRASLASHIFAGQCTLQTNATARACISIRNVYNTPASFLNGIFDIVLNKTYPLHLLFALCECLQLLPFGAKDKRRACCNVLRLRRDALLMSLNPVPSVDTVLASLEKLSRRQLSTLAASHSIETSSDECEDSVRDALVRHMVGGSCRVTNSSLLQAGESTLFQGCAEPAPTTDSDSASAHLQIHLLSTVVMKLSRHPLRRLLRLHDVAFEPDDSVGKLRRLLKHYISILKRGKRPADRRRARQEQNTVSDDAVDNARAEALQRRNIE